MPPGQDLFPDNDPSDAQESQVTFQRLMGYGSMDQDLGRYWTSRELVNESE